MILISGHCFFSPVPNIINTTDTSPSCSTNIWIISEIGSKSCSIITLYGSTTASPISTSGFLEQHRNNL